MPKHHVIERPKWREKIIAYVVEGKTDTEIARLLSTSNDAVARQSITAFRKRHAQEIAEWVEESRQAVKAATIATKAFRSAARDQRWQLLMQVITERAEEMQKEIAGGGTGLMVRDYKSAGDAGMVPIYKIDTGLLAELRALEHEEALEQDELPRQGNVNIDNRTQVLVRTLVGLKAEELG